MQGSIQSFFARPGAPRVRCLLIHAVLGPEVDRNWRRSLTEIWRHPPELDWLTPVLRSASSLQLSFDSSLTFSTAYDSKMRLQARTTAALLSCCSSLEALHLQLEQMAILDAYRFRDVLPAGALPASVTQLTLQGQSQICVPCSRLEAPEFRQLKQLVLRSDRLILQSLSALGDHRPQRLTLRGSRISMTGRGVEDVVQTARELTASGHCLQLRCPTQACIGTDWSLSTQLDPPKQQVDDLIAEFRSWYVATEPADSDVWTRAPGNARAY